MSHLGQAQAAYAGLMTASGTIYREQSGSFAGLGTAAYTAAGTAPCAVFSLGRPREMVMGGQVQSVVPWEVKFPADTVVFARDQVRTGGWTYEVLGHNRGATGILYVMCTCVRLDG